MKKNDMITGYSDQGIQEALEQALQQTENPHQYEIVETLGADQKHTEQRLYQVTLKNSDAS